jgi:hypothetical protein
MLICKIILIAEWALVTTPNAILSGASLITSKNNIPYAYSISQRIEPSIYAVATMMLSGLYIYHAFYMFRNFGDKKIRHLLIRLVYTNLFLLALSIGSIIGEYVGGGIVETGYTAFFYSFVSLSSFMSAWVLILTFFQQLKVELWMLNDIGLLASESLDR